MCPRQRYRHQGDVRHAYVWLPDFACVVRAVTTPASAGDAPPRSIVLAPGFVRKPQRARSVTPGHEAAVTHEDSVICVRLAIIQKSKHPDWYTFDAVVL